jgi:APA family basic amino acid/polyamine antiporter
MSLSSNKIGFWSVFELVTISQIGSGLMLPAQLAIFGTLSLIGWIISGLGALILAIVFAELCVRNPKMGGPHAYIKEAFGPTAAFFSGWTYWIISWVSTVAIITSAVGYISPLLGSTDSTMITLSLEIAIISWATPFKFKGSRNSQ